MNIKDYLCEFMYNFFKSHINELNLDYESCGFDDEYHMLSEIRTDWQTALWSLQEVTWWGMDKDYYKTFSVGSEEGRIICKLDDRYIEIINEDIREVFKKTKQIEIECYE